jgi:hypothetical protein
LLALVVGGAVFGIATAVQADIPDAGVIHGCYGKPGTPQKGQLRVRDASRGEQCRFYENQLDWSQTGPSGVTGPTGPTGPAGTATAKTVTADAFVDLTSALPGTNLATLNLPAGSFVIFARAVYGPQAGITGNYVAECELTAGSDMDAPSGRIIFGADQNSPFVHGEVISMNVLHTFASPGSATLNCVTPQVQAARAGDVRITAIQVSAIS